MLLFHIKTITVLCCACSYKMNNNQKLRSTSIFLQRDTDEEVKEHLRNNLHLQEKVTKSVQDSTFKHENCNYLS